MLSLARRAQEPEHLVYERLLSPLGKHLWQRKSRHSFVRVELELLNDPAGSGTSVARWAEYRWSMEWLESAPRLHTFIKDVSPSSFPRPTWVRLNNF